jgi:bacterioferritin (cytochrome b1)
MFRGYDSGQVLREEIIERRRYLQEVIATLQKSVYKLKEQTATSEEHIQRLKKELDF